MIRLIIIYSQISIFTRKQIKNHLQLHSNLLKLRIVYFLKCLKLDEFSFQIITSMKYTQLSNFQKQQYTNYLEGQLQKFSSFMLSQKKQNEKYRNLQDAIAYQTDAMNQVHARMQLLELYQKQNHANSQHLLNKFNKTEDFENRLRRLEDRSRFGCDEEKIIKRMEDRKVHPNLGESQEQSSQLAYMQENYNEFVKKMKKQQEEIYSCKEAIEHLNKLRITHKFQNLENKINPENIIEKKDLKKLQKKIARQFQEKWEELESKIVRMKSKSSKSPSAKVSELSIIDNYHIRQSKDAINSFRVDDSFSKKSQVSTFLRESKSPRQSKVTLKNQQKKYNKVQKSKSKSKSKKKPKSSSKIKNKDKGISKKSIDQSLSLNNQSISSSSVSHSKSHNTLRHRIIKSKAPNHSKKLKNDHSRQKSHSNSHEICKKRPQFIHQLDKKRNKGERQTNPLKKRQYRRT